MSVAVRTLAVWCADWPAASTGRPGTVPLVVMAANRVISVSAAARADGVRSGIRRREAQARCPAVEVHERDEQREARAFEVVISAIEALAPRLELTEPGCCAIPTRGPSRYHGGDRALAGLVLERVHAALGAGGPLRGSPCPVGVAIADGPRAAAIAAREAVDIDAGRTPLVVASGATAEFLSNLAVEKLGADRNTLSPAMVELCDLLRRLGLRTIGRFAALDSADVVARFGAFGADAHRLANGAETEPPDARDPSADLRVSIVVDPPAERVDRAAFVAKTLADDLHGELAARGLACTRVLVAAETDAGDRIERLWRHEGALSAAAIAQRVRWQLDGWLATGRSLGRCSGGVALIELTPDQVVADVGVQQGFWGDTGGAGERAAAALARVQALLGAEAVMVPEYRGGRSPAEQYRLVPLDTVDMSSREVAAPRSAPPPWPGRLPAPSPAVVWPAPLPAELVDADGERVAVGGRGLISAAPRHCSLDGGPWVTVRAWAGPWCVDERWWDPIAHRRRARLQVVLGPAEGEPSRRGHPSAGAAHLLTLEAGQWHLEATYD